MDPARVEAQVEHLLKNGIGQVFINGTTGECHSLSLEERRRLIQHWMEVTRGTALKVIVQAGGNCLAESRMLAAQAQQLGAIAVAAMAPSYFKPKTMDALVQCAAEVASAAPGLPFFYYEIPSFTGVTLSPHQFLLQARRVIPNLEGIKFSNPDLMSFQLCLNAHQHAFTGLWGMDESVLAALTLGAHGGVGSSYNFAAPIYHRMWTALESGDIAAARLEQMRSAMVIDLLSDYGYLSASKAIMSILGVDVGQTRLPLVALPKQHHDRLRTELEHLGFFEWIRE